MKTLEEKNRMIAEFMGLEHTLNDSKTNKPFSVNFLYHSSWDWLMPVVEKIEDIRIQPDEDEIVSYHRFAVDMPCGQCEIIDTETGKVVAYGDHATKILSTYEAVVEFIEWYNEQKF